MEGIGLNITTQTQLGAVSTQNTEQKSEVKTREVAPTKENQESGVEPRNQEEARFDAVQRAAEFVRGENSFLSDLRYTIYDGAGEEEFTIRFTNTGNGQVTLVKEQQLLGSVAKDTGTILEALA